MELMLEANKSSQNAVIASTAQVDQVASECARGLKTNSLWKYLSSGLNFQPTSVVLLCIQQGARSERCRCHRPRTRGIGLVWLPSVSFLHFPWLQSKS